MPLKTDRLVVDGELGFDPATGEPLMVSRPNGNDWYLRALTNFSWASPTSAPVEFEFTFTWENPKLQLATHLFGYNGKAEKVDQNVSAIIISTHSIPWLKSNGIQLKDGSTIEGEVGLSSVSLKMGQALGGNSEFKLSAKVLDAPLALIDPSALLAYEDSLVISANGEVQKAGKLATWYFDVGDSSVNLSKLVFTGSYLVLFPYCYVWQNDDYDLILDGYDNSNRSDDDIEYGVVYKGTTQADTSFFPYGSITFGFIPKTKEGDQDYNLNMPALTKDQMDKLFDLLADSDTEITKEE